MFSAVKNTSKSILYKLQNKTFVQCDLYTAPILPQIMSRRDSSVRFTSKPDSANKTSAAANIQNPFSKSNTFRNIRAKFEIQYRENTNSDSKSWMSIWQHLSTSQLAAGGLNRLLWGEERSTGSCSCDSESDFNCKITSCQHTRRLNVELSQNSCDKKPTSGPESPSLEKKKKKILWWSSAKLWGLVQDAFIQSRLALLFSS